MVAIGEVAGRQGLMQGADGSEMRQRTLAMGGRKRVEAAGIQADEQHITGCHGQSDTGGDR